MTDSSGVSVRAATDRQNVAPDERRQSPRFRLRDARVCMSWDDGSGPVACEGEVLNISGGGAAVLAERAPPAGVTVRLQLGHSSAVLEPLEARSLACSGDPSGRHLVRLQFSRWISLDAILDQHHERRLWQRFPVRETRAKLTWIVAGSEKTVRGELLNISGGGAAIIVDFVSSAEEPIWFELETDGRALDPVESRMVVTSLDLSGLKIARIKFIDPCPMMLFELAIHGSTRPV